MGRVGALVAMSLDEKFDLKEIEDTVRSRVNVKDLRLKLGEKECEQTKDAFYRRAPHDEWCTSCRSYARQGGKGFVV